MPAPSPRTYPSARASKVLQRPSGCHDASVAEVDTERRRQDDVCAADEGERALAVAQAAACQVDRDQRRRTGGVDRHARPAEIVKVGESVGGDAQRAPGTGVGIDVVRVAELEMSVVIRGNADECAGAAAGKLLRHLPGVFQRLPCHLQQQALLRIHSHRLARRDAEKLGVELVDLIEEPAPASGRGPRGVHIPAVRRYLGDGVHAVAEQPPKSGGPIGARKPAADADNRDRLGRRRGPLTTVDVGRCDGAFVGGSAPG